MMTTVSSCSRTVAKPDTDAASGHQERSCPRGECHFNQFAMISTWLFVSMPLSGKNDDITRVIPMISEMLLLKTGNRDDNVTAMIKEIFVKSA